MTRVEACRPQAPVQTEHCTFPTLLCKTLRSILREQFRSCPMPTVLIIIDRFLLSIAKRCIAARHAQCEAIQGSASPEVQGTHFMWHCNMDIVTRLFEKYVLNVLYNGSGWKFCHYNRAHYVPPNFLCEFSSIYCVNKSRGKHANMKIKNAKMLPPEYLFPTSVFYNYNFAS